MNYSLLLDSALNFSNPYILIITGSVALILSFFFNQIANKTNIPSVLMLIVLGILFNYGLKFLGVPSYDFLATLKLLGIVGVIMIVLEAALDLDIQKEKMGMIMKALGISLLELLLSSYFFALIIQYFIDMDFWTAVLHAAPLAVLSSAIIIPSVGQLSEEKKEFMVYNGTFSDILGIVFFYFVLGLLESGSIETAITQFGIYFILTIIVSFLFGYILVLVFQKIEAGTKLFVLIASLLLIYAVGKLFHLSPLLLILIFGIILTNPKLFFFGPMKNWINIDAIKKIEHEFHIITIETAFVIRTFFFIVFGMTITLASLLSLNVLLISMLILVFMYFIRFALLSLFEGRDFTLQLLIAPRGLITILLFYAIPKNLKVAEFDTGILLFVILISSLIMTFGLIRYGKVPEKKELTVEMVDDI